MARKKFNLEHEAYDIEKATQVQEEVTEEKAEVSTVPVIENEVEKPEIELQEEAPKASEPLKAAAEPAPTPEKPLNTVATAVPVPEVLLSETDNDDYVRIKVIQTAKKETLSKNKMIKMKPSVEKRINQILMEQYEGMAFNSLVNQLLEGWLENTEAAIEKMNKK